MSAKSRDRACSVQVRLSPQELKYLEQVAAEEKVSVAKLLRLRSLYRRLPQKIIDVLPKTYLELAHTSRQVNEVAKQVYQIESAIASLPSASLEDLQAALPELETLLGQIRTQVVMLGLQTQIEELREIAQYDV